MTLYIRSRGCMAEASAQTKLQSTTIGQVGAMLVFG
jgi:hypothetical protein